MFNFAATRCSAIRTSLLVVILSARFVFCATHSQIYMHVGGGMDPLCPQGQFPFTPNHVVASTCAEIVATLSCGSNDVKETLKGLHSTAGRTAEEIRDDWTEKEM
ncbi:hypothetical protein B0H10DRAFT_1970542 [Mycena sp. CBHHK59/15]|nr:hypothetical protein B0H10DRAFT_1970542 [Mycena sp. CBHHK59/15]